MTVYTNTWKMLFMGLESNVEIDKNLNVLATATMIDDSSIEAEMLRTLTEDPESILMTVAPVTGKMKFIYNTANLGGTRIRPKNKLVA